METHSSILAWEILRTEEPGGLQSMGSQELDMTEWLNNKQQQRVCVCVCVDTPESKSCVLDLGQDSFCINKSELSVDAFVDYTSFASVIVSIAPFVQYVYWTPSKLTVILQLQCGKQSCTQCDFFFPSNSQLVRKKLWDEPPERPWKKNHKISTRAIMNWWACCYRGLPGASWLWQGSIIIFRIRRRKLRLDNLWCALGSESPTCSTWRMSRCFWLWAWVPGFLPSWT